MAWAHPPRHGHVLLQGRGIWTCGYRALPKLWKNLPWVGCCRWNAGCHNNSKYVHNSGADGCAGRVQFQMFQQQGRDLGSKHSIDHILQKVWSVCLVEVSGQRQVHWSSEALGDWQGHCAQDCAHRSSSGRGRKRQTLRHQVEDLEAWTAILPASRVPGHQRGDFGGCKYMCERTHAWQSWGRSSSGARSFADQEEEGAATARHLHNQKAYPTAMGI